MRRTVTRAPTAMTGPRAKGATAALAGAGAEGEAATRDMGPIDVPSRRGRTPTGTLPGAARTTRDRPFPAPPAARTRPRSASRSP